MRRSFELPGDRSLILAKKGFAGLDERCHLHRFREEGSPRVLEETAVTFREGTPRDEGLLVDCSSEILPHLRKHRTTEQRVVRSGKPWIWSSRVE